MTAKIRPNLISAMWDVNHAPGFKNLLVNGDSFTFNNSDVHCCTWPYYLADSIGLDFDQIYDCSQSGGGTGHVLYSTINEIETNKNLSPESTLVIVMYSGLHGTDVIAQQSITKKWHHMSNYCFNDELATLSLFRKVDDPENGLGKLCNLYADTIGKTEQIYQSCLNIIALKNYLDNKNFKFIFTSRRNPNLDLALVDNQLSDQVKSMFNQDLEYIGDWTKERNLSIPGDGHPTPEGHIQWCRQQLLPFLLTNKFVIAKDMHNE
jgi:hypothetical protein